MLAFAAAVQTSEPIRYATVEPAFGIALLIAGALAGYALGGASLPRWVTWVIAALWPMSLAILMIASGTLDAYCSSDPHTLATTRAWIGVFAFAIALACPAFLGRKLSSKHIIAAPVGIGLAGLGLALAIAVSFDWMTRPCVGVVM